MCQASVRLCSISVLGFCGFEVLEGFLAKQNAHTHRFRLDVIFNSADYLNTGIGSDELAATRLVIKLRLLLVASVPLSFSIPIILIAMTIYIYMYFYHYHYPYSYS